MSYESHVPGVSDSRAGLNLIGSRDFVHVWMTVAFCQIGCQRSSSAQTGWYCCSSLSCYAVCCFFHGMISLFAICWADKCYLMDSSALNSHEVITSAGLTFLGILGVTL